MNIDKLLRKALDQEEDQLQQRLNKIRSVRGLLNGTRSGSGNGGRKKRHMSKAGRMAIAKAQRLRWKKIREEK